MLQYAAIPHSLLRKRSTSVCFDTNSNEFSWLHGRIDASIHLQDQKQENNIPHWRQLRNCWEMVWNRHVQLTSTGISGIKWHQLAQLPSFESDQRQGSQLMGEKSGHDQCIGGFVNQWPRHRIAARLLQVFCRFLCLSRVKNSGHCKGGEFCSIASCIFGRWCPCRFIVYRRLYYRVDIYRNCLING